jgi:uncharacterized protein
MMDNVEFVQSLYDAFNRGDLETIFAASDPNIDWISNADPALIPWGGERKGVAAVKEFFKELAAHMEIESFTPREFFGGPDFVTVLGHVTGRLMPSGSHFDDEWAHIFKIKDEKIVEFREYLNTHALVQAYFGGDIHSVTVAPSDLTAPLHH